jgi:protoheme IX farnesyltransferase
VTVRAAAIASATCLAAGLALLLVLGRGPWPAVWGATAVVLYNGAYTPLKTRSLWGLVAGAVSGALPVLIGWHASLAISPAPPQSVLQAACVFLLLFAWQMPHFWLLMLHHREDYAALPGFVALRSFGSERLKAVTMAWVACFAALLLLVPLTGAVDSRAAAWVLTAAAAAVSVLFLHGLFGAPERFRPLRLFVGLNLCVCLLMAVVVADKILFRLFLLQPRA